MSQAHGIFNEEGKKLGAAQFTLKHPIGRKKNQFMAKIELSNARYLFHKYVYKIITKSREKKCICKYGVKGTLG